MPLQRFDLIFNDTPSQHNKDLTDYLSRNIRDVIVKGNIKLHFKIAKTADLQDIRRKGIKRLPALVPIRGRAIIGVPKIIEFLRVGVRKSKGTVAPKSEDEVLQDYFTKELGASHDGEKIVIPDDDDEGMDNIGDELHSKFMEAQRARSESMNKPKSRTANREPPPKPSRDMVPDDEYTNRAPQPMERGNNILEPGDPRASLNAISKGGKTSVDDDMMMKLIERSGGDSMDF